MRKTTNYGLALYELKDKMSITAGEYSLNNNMELIDEALKNKATLTDMTNYIEEHKDELKGADGKDGENGSNGKDGTNGTNGTDGYSPTIEVSKEGRVTTVTITDINGTKTVTINDGKDGTGVDESTDILLGKTPYTATKDISKLKLVANGECSYIIKSPTIGDLNTASIGAPTKATFTKYDDYYELINAGGTTAFYQTYMDVTFNNLVVGNTYTFVRDSSGITFGDKETYETYGHYIIYDGNNTTLFNGGDNYDKQKATHTFKAPTTSVRVRLYPSTAYCYSDGVSVGRFRNIYINEGTTTDYTGVVDLSGTFTDTALLPNIPKGVTINSTPTCSVYEVDNGSDEEAVKSRHAGKVCVCFGDSITGNMLPPGDYCSAIAEETGMTVYNGGFGGCRMSTHPTEHYAAFSMHNLADAVATGDWTLQDTHVASVSSYIHADVQLTNLKEVDWSKVDFITIAYGTNDIASNVLMDNTENEKDVTTVLGALRYSIERILTAYPHIKILLLTPIYRYWNDEDLDSDERTFTGGTFTDFADGIIKVGEEYKIPVVDMYRTLGFNKITRSYYFPSNDGTHPNSTGLKLMGGKIAGKLLSEY